MRISQSKLNARPERWGGRFLVSTIDNSNNLD
jgi:hypothetical protein